MSRRLLLTGGIPILGLIFLFAGLALATRDLADVSVTYDGHDYTGGRIVAASEAAREGAAPTGERIDGLQVWVPQPQTPAQPVLLLLRADGRFHRYELEGGQ